MMDEAMRDYLLSFDGVDDGPVYINRSGRRIGAGEWLFASDSVGGVVSVVPARTATDSAAAVAATGATLDEVAARLSELGAQIRATRYLWSLDTDPDDQEGDLAE